MTSTLPSGDGAPDGAETDGALDPDSAPATGLEPDTAPDAAGEQETSVAATGTLTDSEPTDSEPTDSEPTDSEPTDQAVDGAPEPDDEPERPALGDPALDNEQEMQEAGADLQSSREKSATARDISDQLTAATRPEAVRTERS